MAVELPGEAYERGHLAGEIAARLAGHDTHFHDINGQIIKVGQQIGAMAVEVGALTLAVQRLADQAESDAKTRVSTAAAVEKARQETAQAVESERLVRRERSETAWTPFARGLAVLTGLVGIVAVIATIVALTRH